MVSYRGIPQSDVVKSLIDACSLIRNYPPGIECEKEGNKLMTSIFALQMASSDEEFVEALHDSNVSSLLRMHDLFEAYALNNTGGLGRQVFENLQSWGAFSGAIAGMTKADEEINIYRFMTGLHHIDYVDERHARAVIEASGFVTDESEISRGISDLRGAIHAAQKGASVKELTDIYHQLNVSHADGRIVRLLAETLSRDASLFAEPLFDRYGVVIPGMTPKNYQEKLQKNQELVEKINEILAPFHASDEVLYTAVGVILNPLDKTNPGPLGITFNATARAGQAVADALSDKQILRSDGRAIKPSKPSSEKAKGFQP